MIFHNMPDLRKQIVDPTLSETERTDAVALLRSWEETLRVHSPCDICHAPPAADRSCACDEQIEWEVAKLF